MLVGFKAVGQQILFLLDRITLSVSSLDARLILANWLWVQTWQQTRVKTLFSPNSTQEIKNFKSNNTPEY